MAVIGRGITVGRTIGLLLSRRGVDATVVNCHTRTRDLPAIVRGADVVIAAVGSPRLVTADWVAEGAVVVDVGVSRTVDPDGRARIVGDVAPDVRDVASWVSPNPGGVGPMTRAMLGNPRDPPEGPRSPTGRRPAGGEIRAARRGIRQPRRSCA